MFINITSVNILNVSIYPILSYKFDRISCNISELFCKEFNKGVLKCIWIIKGLRILTKMLTEKQMEGLALPDIKIHYKTIVKPCIIALREEKYTSVTENIGINMYI